MAQASLGVVCAWLGRTSGDEGVAAYMSQVTTGQTDTRHVALLLFVGPPDDSGETMLGNAFTKRGARVIA